MNLTHSFSFRFFLSAAPVNWAARCVSSFFDQSSSSSLYKNFPNDTRCDCACGMWDPDCNVRTNPLYCTPDQSKYAPTEGNFACSPSTLQCRTGPSPAVNTSTWIAYFDEFTYGTAPDRTVPSCDCGLFTEWDPDCDMQSSVLRGTITTNCAADEYCSVTTNECVAIANPNFVRAPDCAPVLYDQLNSATYGELGIPTCDCGCGVWDPDCDSSLLRYQYDGSLFELNCFDNTNSPSSDRSSFCQKNSNTCGQGTPFSFFHFFLFIFCYSFSLSLYLHTRTHTHTHVSFLKKEDFSTAKEITFVS